MLKEKNKDINVKIDFTDVSMEEQLYGLLWCHHKIIFIDINATDAAKNKLLIITQK